MNESNVCGACAEVDHTGVTTASHTCGPTPVIEISYTDNVDHEEAKGTSADVVVTGTDQHSAPVSERLSGFRIQAVRLGPPSHAEMNEFKVFDGILFGRRGASEPWCHVTTAMPGLRSARLRKLVWRGDQLIEVRTRGRTGHRDLLAAVRAAGPCPGVARVVPVTLVAHFMSVNPDRGIDLPVLAPSLDIDPKTNQILGVRNFSFTSGSVSPDPAAKEAPMVICDVCGVDYPADQHGSSWISIPDSDISSEDMRDRCAACTQKHGPLARPPAGGTRGVNS